MIINAITGFSGSLRKSSESLPGFVKETFGGWGNVLINNEYSSDSKCLDNSLKFMKCYPLDDLLLIGKSLGGVRTWWLATKYWENLKGRLDYGYRVGIVLLDPHGWQLGDGTVGSFGVGSRNLKYDKRWDPYIDDPFNVLHKCHVSEPSKMCIMCIYQSNKYPKGAIIEGGKNVVDIHLGKNANHWNIEDLSTETGRFVQEYVENMGHWVRPRVITTE